MILAIVISTMFTVALVVLALQFNIYRKILSKRDTAFTSRETAAGKQEAPITS